MYELCCRIGDDPTTLIGMERPGIFPPGQNFGFNPVLGDGPSTARALLIARTELTGALNAGHDVVLKQLESDGIIVGRAWYATDDEHVREAHAMAEDEFDEGNPVKGNGLFTLHTGLDAKNGEDETCRYPGDMNLSPAGRCNCRCRCEGVWEDEQAAAQQDQSEDEDVDAEKRITAIAQAVTASVTKALDEAGTIGGLLLPAPCD
jgi:hypothetical protein